MNMTDYNLTKTSIFKCGSTLNEHISKNDVKFKRKPKILPDTNRSSMLIDSR